MFHALNLVESGQVYIKDVNSFARSQREKRGPHNEEEFSEVEYFWPYGFQSKAPPYAVC